MKCKLASLGSLSLLLALATPIPVNAQDDMQDVHYTVTDLGMVGAPPGQAFAVTRNGLISGDFQAKSGVLHAALWLNQYKLDIGRMYLHGTTNSMLFGANVWGQAVGMVQTSTIDPNSEDFCGFRGFGLPSNGGTCRPFVWQIGKGFTILPTLGGPNGSLNEINISGQIAGQAENNKVDPVARRHRCFRPNRSSGLTITSKSLRPLAGIVRASRSQSTTGVRPQAPPGSVLPSASSCC